MVRFWVIFNNVCGHFELYRLRGPHKQISQQFYMIRLLKTIYQIEFLDSSN
jgi:hypothetical protein